MGKNIYIFTIIFSISLWINGLYAQTIFFEDFETGSIPSGWSQDYVIGTENWAYNNGGDSGHPASAHGGSYNALFFYGSYGDETTKLITPQIDITTVATPTLKFWHTQFNWGADQDELYIYYRTDAGSSWQLLQSYTSAITAWTEREILLPNPTTTYQIAFEAKTGYGYGVCVDDVIIEGVPPVPKFLNSISIHQHETTFVYQNSDNNPIIRIDLEVGGNSGTLLLEDLITSSLNTTDNDMDVNGVKLFYTSGTTFSTDNQLLAGVDFVLGDAAFNSINYDLPAGLSYIWITYDIKNSATPYNIVDAYIQAGNITINGTTYPSIDESPVGEKEILQTIYYDDFSSNNGWTLTGEFEIDIPQGLGGSYGDPDPPEAYIGNKVLGTDLTGMGAYPYDYEPNLANKAYIATSPVIDCSYFKDISLNFQRWLNLDLFDNTTVEISNDNGSIWHIIWQSAALMEAEAWELIQYDISGYADFQSEVLIRFTLGSSDGTWNYSGWNIDEFALTGDFISNETEITAILAPVSGCGHSASDSITVIVQNNGGVATNDTIPVCFSIDGGIIIYDTIFSSIPVGKDTAYTFIPTVDLSIPNDYHDVFAATLLPMDEDTSNDTLYTQLQIFETYTIPYFENFEAGNGSWFSGGINHSWGLGAPNGTTINTASSGTSAWVTNLNGNYNNNEVSYVESPCFDFTGIDYAVIEFNAWWSCEPGYDGTAVQYTLDGFTWETIGVFGDNVNWYNHNFLTGLVDGYSTNEGWNGETGGWITVSHSLPAAISNQNMVKFRIIFGSNSANNSFEGFAFDDVRIYEMPPDVGVISINSPVNSCLLSSNEYISVSIVNYGMDTIVSGDSIPVGYSINSGVDVIEYMILSLNLCPSDTIDYTFFTSGDFSITGNYNINSFTILPGDYTSLNDSASKTIIVSGNPVIDLGPDILTLFPDTVILDAWIGNEYDYLWSDGSSLPTYAVSNAGTYYVTVTDSLGCWTIDSIEITELIFDLEVTELISPVSDCELNSSEEVIIKITNTGSYVIPIDSAIYVSYSVNGSAPNIDTIVIVTNLFPTGFIQYTFDSLTDMSIPDDYNFTFILNNPLDINPNNDTLYRTISVYGNPVIDLGPDTISTFQPDTIVLHAGSGYSQYLWQDNSTDSVYYVSNPGTYYVTVIDNFGCWSTDSVEIISLAFDLEITEIIAPVSDCELGSAEEVIIEITNTGSYVVPIDSVIYVSYSVNGLTPNIDTIVLVNNLIPGGFIQYTFDSLKDMSIPNDYNFTFALNHPLDVNPNNDTLYRTISVYGNPVIDLGPDTISTFQPDTVVLHAGSGYSQYLWQDSSTDSVYYVSSAGTYYVQIVDSLGCENSDTIFIDLISNKFEANNCNNILYPNPSKGQIFIKCTETIFQVNIYNNLGQLHQKYTQINEQNVILNPDQINSGIYYIEILYLDGVKTIKKIIIQ